MAELTMESLTKMKVAELKKELKERGLSTAGAKSELLERLKSALPTDETEALLAADDSIDLNNSSVLQEEVKEEPLKVTATKEIGSENEETVEKKEDPHPEKVSIVSSTGVDPLKKRAERFGVVNEDMKKQLRAERFGTPSSGAGKSVTAGSGSNVDVLKKRAERFGQVVSKSLAKEDEAEKIRKRKDRFGDVTASTNNTSTPPKFAKITFNSTDEEKKKKRLERFGQV